MGHGSSFSSHHVTIPKDVLAIAFANSSNSLACKKAGTNPAILPRI